MKNCHSGVAIVLPIRYTTRVNTDQWTHHSMKKPYPLGYDNPYVVRQVYGSNRWALYRREDFQKVATFPNQFVAYDCRRAILNQEGYDA